MEVTIALIPLFALLGLGACFFTIIVFSLIKAGRRADEGEEKILRIISPASPIYATERASDRKRSGWAALPSTRNGNQLPPL